MARQAWKRKKETLRPTTRVPAKLGTKVPVHRLDGTVDYVFIPYVDTHK